MKLHRIIEDIDASKAIIERWAESNSMPTIEKDILLTNLQNIYREVLAMPSQVVADVVPKQSSTVEFIIEPEEQVEPIVEEEAESVIKEALPEPIVVEQVVEKLTVEPVLEPQEELMDYPEPVVEDYHEPVIEDQPESAVEDYPEPIIEEQSEPVPEFRVIFGQRVPNELIDRFIMELFWRDEQFFVNEVSKLAAQPTLDAALFYICEKYNWSAKSKTAEQFTELLANYQFE